MRWMMELARFALVLFVFVYFGTAMDLFMLSKGYVGIPPTKILMAAAGAYAFLLLIEPGHHALNRALTNINHAAGPVVMYILFCTTFVAWGLHPTANLQGGAAYVYLSLYNLMFFGLAFLAFSDEAILKHRKLLLFVPFLVMVVSIWVEIKWPLLFTDEEFGRKSGFASQPNAAAFFIVIFMLMLLDFKRPKITDMIIYGVGAIGVFATFSRGGYLLTIIVGVLMATKIILSGKTKPMLTLAAGVVMLYAFFYLAVTELHYLEKGGAYQRLELMLSGDFEEIVEGESTEDRKDLFDKHLALALESPVLGHGTGYTYTGLEGGGPHNVYLQIWCNQGLLGVLMVIGLLFAMVRHFWRYRDVKGLVFVCLLIVEGFLNHNIYDQRPVILLMAAFTAYIVSSKATHHLARSEKERAIAFIRNLDRHRKADSTPAPARRKSTTKRVKETHVDLVL
ncbi:O-antigen ligase family protein [Granulosicoccaceae sp. 1_MG-2023]|nr:O-antigen ligase family protein [Granulosicoccaceae sp. 1_MG-2023]